MTHAASKNAPRSRFRTFRARLGGWVLPALACSVLGQIGCAIVVVDHDGGETTPGTGDSGAGGATTSGTDCSSTTPTDPPDEVAVTGAKSALFVGGFLHLEALANGEPSYLVLAIDAPGVAHVVAAPDELLGPANLVEIAGGTHARVRGGPAGTVVEVIDTTNPAAPALLAKQDVSGQAGTVFAAADQRIFFCDLLPGFDEQTLVSVDLGVPSEPGGPVGFESKMCNRFPGGGMAANGPTWMAWGPDEDVDLYSVGAEGEKKIGDYWYSAVGVHNYGAVQSGASDATRAVADPGNDSEMFLFDLQAPQPIYVTHAYFGIKGPKHMLGVVDAIVYMATAEEVRAYDISDVTTSDLSDITEAKLLPYQAEVDFGSNDARLLATSADYLAIADAGGALYLVPRSAPGKVLPLKVYDAPPPEKPCAP